MSLNKNIMILGTQFQQGSHKHIQVPKNKLPEHLKYAYVSTKFGEKFILTMENVKCLL